VLARLSGEAHVIRRRTAAWCVALLLLTLALLRRWGSVDLLILLFVSTLSLMPVSLGKHVARGLSRVTQARLVFLASSLRPALIVGLACAAVVLTRIAVPGATWSKMEDEMNLDTPVLLAALFYAVLPLLWFGFTAIDTVARRARVSKATMGGLGALLTIYGVFHLWGWLGVNFGAAMRANRAEFVIAAVVSITAATYTAWYAALLRRYRTMDLPLADELTVGVIH
jgi:hypothetical protein